MTHEDAFLQEIFADREDDTPRRVFADWLLDHHDPVRQARGEFIHLQCDLARRVAGSPRPVELLRRERELLWEHGGAWGGLARFGCVCWEYRRGFVEGVGLPVTAFLANAAALLRAAPLRDLKLYDAAGRMAELAACPWLVSVRGLDLEQNDLGDADLSKLAVSPHLGRLESLLLWNNRAGDVGTAALARAELPALTRLDLSNNQIGDAGTVALAMSPLLGRLRVLDLTGNGIGDAGAAALALAARGDARLARPDEESHCRRPGAAARAPAGAGSGAGLTMTLLVLWHAFVFLLGAAVGSFLNVVAGRLPYEKSLLWPGSRCEACFQPIRWFDNVPLMSYFVLGGRCRTCAAAIPARLPLVELITALAFVALFHLEMVVNVLALPSIDRHWGLAPGLVPLEALLVFVHHAVLLSFLLAASLCDLADMEIPMSITFCGTLVGLVLATLLPWPTPEALVSPPAPDLWGRLNPAPPSPGVYAWPVWYPLPVWLPPGSWRLGLVTGLAGALAGMAVLRLVRFLFTLGRGIEGMGVGDADLMMMAGAFVGWQPVLLAFFVSVFPALIFAIVKLIVTRRQDLPFGPSLAFGVMLTVLTWPILGATFLPLFFDAVFLGLLGTAGAVALLAASFLLRLVNR